jgi:hypothetical protein
MHKLSKSFEALLVFLLFFLALNLRPAILQIYGKIIFLSVTGLIVFMWLLGFRARLPQRKKVYLILSGLYIIYLLFQSLIFKSYDLNLLFTLLFILTGVVVSIQIKEEMWRYALYAIVYPVLFFSISYFVTIILIVSTPLAVSDITYHVLKVYQPGVVDSYSISFVFPFSPMVGIGNVGFGIIDIGRAGGYMREPGVFQILIAISFFGLDFIKFKYKKLFKSLLILTLILTFSTAGIAVFIVSYIYYYYIAKGEKLSGKAIYKVASFLLILTVMLFFIFTDEKFGLLAKLTYGSGEQRLDRYFSSIQLFLGNPIIGWGLVNSKVEGNSIFSMFASLGIAGMSILFFMILLPLINLIKRKDPVLVFFIPVLLTAMFGQPLFDKALFYIILSLVISYPIKYNYIENDSITYHKHYHRFL